MGNYLIVDGYNIIFAWSEFRLVRKDNIEHARIRLVDILTDYAAMVEEKVVLVFDAHLVEGSKEKIESITDKFQVLYTQEGETADSAIERLVSKLASGSRVYVATSDWAEQSMIFGMGAYRITPGELAVKIKTVKKDSSRHYLTDYPADSYLENRLVDNIRKKLEEWRKGG